jgi:hypothetical protein
MDKIGIKMGYLGADRPVGNGIHFRAPHADNLIACNRHGETAGVRAIERAHAGLFCVHIDLGCFVIGLD